MLSDSIEQEMTDDIEVISFDIFDTLILRPFVRPTDLFWMMGQELNDPGFHDRRIMAESDARRRKGSEITLDEIYENLDVPENVKELECELETTLCFRNEPVCKELDDYSKDHTIIITSDMYLPRSVIEAILEKNGIRYDRLYLSSEIGKTKHSGKLFDHILEDLSIPPSKMLHIGDNRHSDVNVPKRKGIRTSYRKAPISEYLGKHTDERRYLRRHDGLISSIIIAMDMMRKEDENIWYDIGNRYGGPLAYAYSRYLKEVCGKDSLIAFASRDGYSLKKCFELLSPGSGTCYIHPQRLLMEMFFDDYVQSEEDLRMPDKFKDMVGYGRFMARLRRLLIFYGISSSDDLPKDPNKLLKLFNENRHLMNESRKEKLSSYKGNLDSICEDKDVELVDCTTMKFSSQRFVEKVLGRSIRGHYSITLNDDPSLSYDSMYRWPKAFIGWSRVNIPEFLLCSPELPICGWKDDSPIYDENSPQCEKDRAEKYQELSNGILGYSETILSIFGKHSPKMDYDSVLYWVMLCTAKGTKYRDLLKDVKWASNPDHSDWSPIIPWDNVFGLFRRYAIDVLFKLSKSNR